ncbi:hypothetical protein ACFPIF_00085 [Brevundimonas faecalis]|uniref:hypothetical protein n=1 Tax=Brevundimonas faecalis TaxID=947378 RepID=UPI003615FD97
MRLKTEGFADLERALLELKPATAKRVLRRVGLEALQPVADGMRAKAPTHLMQLHDAIDVGTRRSKRNKKHFPDPDVIEVYAGVKVVDRGMPPQGVQQEFGNENHGPQPFARPTWDREEMPTLDRVKVSLTAEIDKAAARAKRKAMKAKR